MPAATIVNIQWNPGTKSWQGASANISKAGGIVFNVAFPATKTGVRICLNDSDVFGVSYLDYTTPGNQSPPVTGSVGQSSSYHLQNSGTDCQPVITANDPYVIEIGSSLPRAKAPSRKSAVSKKKVTGSKKRVAASKTTKKVVTKKKASKKKAVSKKARRR